MSEATQTGGSSKRRLTELHLVTARDRALSIFYTTSTMFPVEWATQLVVERTTVDVSEFAYHARRVIDLCGFRNRKFDHVNQTRFGLTPGQNIVFISDFHEALNRLHHVKEMEFHWAVWTGEKVFTASQKNLSPSFVRVETDQRPSANICLFGLAVCFLNSVISEVKSAYPEYQF